MLTFLIRPTWFSEKKVAVFIFHTVVPLQEDMEVSSLSEPIRDGTNVELTCTLNRVKPEAEMFWMIDDEILNGSSSTLVNEDGNSLTQRNKLLYRYEFLTILSLIRRLKYICCNTNLCRIILRFWEKITFATLHL